MLLKLKDRRMCLESDKQTGREALSIILNQVNWIKTVLTEPLFSVVILIVNK